MSQKVDQTVEEGHELLAFSGNIELKNNNLSIDSLKVQFKDMSINLAGTIQNLDSPDIDITLTSPKVTMEDLILLISFWLDELPPNQSEYDLAPEIGDGRIDFQDFAVLAQDWLKQM